MTTIAELVQNDINKHINTNPNTWMKFITPKVTIIIIPKSVLRQTVGGNKVIIRYGYESTVVLDCENLKYEPVGVVVDFDLETKHPTESHRLVYMNFKTTPPTTTTTWDEKKVEEWYKRYKAFRQPVSSLINDANTYNTLVAEMSKFYDVKLIEELFRYKLDDKGSDLDIDKPNIFPVDVMEDRLRQLRKATEFIKNYGKTSKAPEPLIGEYVGDLEITSVIEEAEALKYLENIMTVSLNYTDKRVGKYAELKIYQNRLNSTTGVIKTLKVKCILTVLNKSFILLHGSHGTVSFVEECNIHKFKERYNGIDFVPFYD